MLKNNRHDVVIHDPSEEGLVRLDRKLCQKVNQEHRYFKVPEMGNEQLEHFREDSDGFDSRWGMNGSLPRVTKMMSSIAGLAWFTLVNGGRHVRLFSDRLILGYEYSVGNKYVMWLGGTTMIDPYPCECVYPCLYLNIPGWVKEIATGAGMAYWIKDHPLDAECRRIFADWCQDQGQNELANDQLRVAEFIEGGCVRVF